MKIARASTLRSHLFVHMRDIVKNWLEVMLSTRMAKEHPYSSNTTKIYSPRGTLVDEAPTISNLVYEILSISHLTRTNEWMANMLCTSFAQVCEFMCKQHLS